MVQCGRIIIKIFGSLAVDMLVLTCYKLSPLPWHFQSWCQPDEGEQKYNFSEKCCTWIMMRSTSTFLLFKSLCFSRISANFRWGKWNLVWESFLSNSPEACPASWWNSKFPFCFAQLSSQFSQKFQTPQHRHIKYLVKAIPCSFCPPMCSSVQSVCSLAWTIHWQLLCCSVLPLKENIRKKEKISVSSPKRRGVATRLTTGTKARPKAQAFFSWKT